MTPAIERFTLVDLPIGYKEVLILRRWTYQFPNEFDVIRGQFAEDTGVRVSWLFHVKEWIIPECVFVGAGYIAILGDKPL